MGHEVHYKTIDGRLMPTTWDEAFAAAERVWQYMERVRARFPGRDEVIDKMLYGLLTRHHVNMTGPHGTAKSLMCNTVLDGIVGARIFRDQITKETKISDVFGPLDFKSVREGRPVHLVDGMMTTANFVYLTEIMDGTDFTLRGIMGAFHPRREVRLGREVYQVPLLTGFTDTNFDPEDDPDRQRVLAAFIDRFLLQVYVNYLEDPSDRVAMFTSALDNAYNEPVGELEMHDVELVSGIVHAMNLVRDPYVVSAWEEATRGLRAHRNRPENGLRIQVSDRRMVQAMVIMEAHALLRGRKEVTFEDINEARHVLCADTADKAFFDDEVPLVVTSWVDRANNRAIDAERQQVQALLANLPKADVQQLDSEQEIANLIQGFEQVRDALLDFDGDHAVVRREIHERVSEVEVHIAAGQQRLVVVLVGALPTTEHIDGDTAVSRLHRERESIRKIEQGLKSFVPVNDAVRTAQREALDLAMRRSAEIETILNGGGL